MEVAQQAQKEMIPVHVAKQAMFPMGVVVDPDHPLFGKKCHVVLQRPGGSVEALFDDGRIGQLHTGKERRFIPPQVFICGTGRPEVHRLQEHAVKVKDLLAWHLRHVEDETLEPAIRSRAVTTMRAVVRTLVEVTAPEPAS